MLVTSALVLTTLSSAGADTVNVPSLIISQLKITSNNGQFVTLYNTTDTALDMGMFQLKYLNNYNPAKATSLRLIPLTGTVPPHGYFMINNSTLHLCYELTIESLSLGLSSTAGRLELTSQADSIGDSVAWSKSATSQAQTLPSSSDAFLQRQSLVPEDDLSPDTATWQTAQPDPDNPCALTINPDSSVPQDTPLLPADPPATIIDSPAVNDLLPPQITELLPNPAGTGTDKDQEFIELYNPNDTDYDLSNFSLQVGTTTIHSFVFPSGTLLPADSFTPFFPSVTGLTLSNSGGKAELFDPAGDSVSTTDAYGEAKDGLAWALAQGKWYWTMTATPGSANIINQPYSARDASLSFLKHPKASHTSKAKKTSRAKKAKKAKTTKSKKPKTTLVSAHTLSDQIARTPVHVWTLALVATLALLYGLYEYRKDLANCIHWCRSYIKHR